MSVRWFPMVLVVAPMLVGCSGGRSPEATPPPCTPCPACPAGGGQWSSGPTADDPPVGAPPSTAEAAIEPAPDPSSAPAPAEADRPDSLPEVIVKNVGLHIGGGPNDAAAKAPIRDAIALRFADFRRCYRHVSDPGKGGIFGVDLRIGRDGGHPKIQQARTGMRGKEFRECVNGVFSEVKFPKPPRGPTVVSYSIRFSVGGK